MKYELALLGIDGSGKSTMSGFIRDYILEKGYKPKIVPFHKWIFADLLRSYFGKKIDKGRKDRKSPYIPQKRSLAALVKPPVAFLDNIFFYLTNKPKKDRDFVIFDRFICATQIKFQACNYMTIWFKPLWWNLKPKHAIIFLIDEKESKFRQEQRGDEYAWDVDQLRIERKMYLEYANKHGFPVISTSKKTPDETFDQVKTYIDKMIDAIGER